MVWTICGSSRARSIPSSSVAALTLLSFIVEGVEEGGEEGAVEFQTRGRSAKVRGGQSVGES